MLKAILDSFESQNDLFGVGAVDAVGDGATGVGVGAGADGTSEKVCSRTLMLRRTLSTGSFASVFMQPSSPESHDNPIDDFRSIFLFQFTDISVRLEEAMLTFRRLGVRASVKPFRLTYPTAAFRTFCLPLSNSNGRVSRCVGVVCEFGTAS